MQDPYDVEMVVDDDVTITVRVEANHVATAVEVARTRLEPLLRPGTRYQFNSIRKIR